MYETALTNAGLTQKQAKIYLAALELGTAKIPALAKKAGIKRTTAYGIADELVSLGLLGYSAKNASKIFQAQKPKNIASLLEARKQEIERVLPDLEALYTKHHLQPHLQFFEGKEGIKRIYEDTLTSRSKKLLQIIRVKDFIEFPGGTFAKEYIHKRVERDITAYSLHPSSGDIHNELYAKESVELKRYVRYLPAHIFHASTIMIYDYKVAMISTKAENFGFIIESKEFSSTLQAYFDFMWKLGTAKPEG